MGRWTKSSESRSRLSSAQAGGMPAFIEPAIATLATRPPSAGAWAYEIKFDGYRMLARIDAGDVRILTRNGHNWTARLPHLRAALAGLPVQSAWLDAEAVWFDASGLPSFNGLQNAFNRRRTAGISLVIFDLMWLDEVDLRPRPWRERRAALSDVVSEILGAEVRFSEAIEAAPDSMLASACEIGLEGIIGKQVDAPYGVIVLFVQNLAVSFEIPRKIIGLARGRFRETVSSGCKIWRFSPQRRPDLTAPGSQPAATSGRRPAPPALSAPPSLRRATHVRFPVPPTAR